MSSILKVELYGNKSHIVLDEEQYKKVQSSSSISTSRSTKFIAERSRSRQQSRSDSTETKDRTLNDELRELNTASQDEVQWEFEGEKVVPKSINVARLMRSNFHKTLRFNRVRLEKFNASFQRQDFTIDTMKALTSHEVTRFTLNSPSQNM